MRFCVVTLLPEILAALNAGVIGRAIKNGIIHISHINPRDYADNKHKTVDDTPFGGGPGMLMMTKPLHQAILEARKNIPQGKIIYLSPQGKRFDQALAKHAAQSSDLIMIAGRYEGIDQRIIDEYVDEEWSLGDYVISGGELAALVMIDAIARCVPGVIGDAGSVIDDSFYHGLLKHPQYTRPENYQGRTVPKVLLSGDHKKIARWRKKQSIGITWLKRPDLLDKQALSLEALTLLDEFIKEQRVSEETS